MIPLFMFFHSEYSLIAPSANLAEEILYAKVQRASGRQVSLSLTVPGYFTAAFLKSKIDFQSPSHCKV